MERSHKYTASPSPPYLLAVAGDDAPAWAEADVFARLDALTVRVRGQHRLILFASGHRAPAWARQAGVCAYSAAENYGDYGRFRWPRLECRLVCDSHGLLVFHDPDRPRKWAGLLRMAAYCGLPYRVVRPVPTTTPRADGPGRSLFDTPPPPARPAVREWARLPD